MKYLKLFFSFSIVGLISCEYERIDTSFPCDESRLSIEVVNIENTACNQSNGEIVVLANGANEDFEFSINGSDFQDDSVFSGLNAGIYAIVARVKDTECNTNEIEAEVENTDGVNISLVSKADTECGSENGSIIVSQTGGVEPIQYQLNEGNLQSSNEFTNLGPGSFTVRAIDANNCEAEINNIRITTGVSLTDAIQPIIATNCAVSGCHNGTQSPDLSVKENIVQNASRIRTRTSNGTMPPAGRTDLTDEEIQLIECWVQDGALDN